MNIFEFAEEFANLSVQRKIEGMQNLMKEAIERENFDFIERVLDDAVEEAEDDGFGTEGLEGLI